MGKVLIIIGIALVIAGILLTYAPNALNWFGRLPGDIRIEGERGGFYFPIVSMIIVSVILSLIMRFLQR